MKWLLAFVIIAAAVALLVGGTVLHPVLYGFFIAGVIVVPALLVSGVVGAVIDRLFGIRR